ncbi:MAG: hypothetical protein IJQ02_00215, partial [Oscillospiraceae bacterium]|nr:hypothetical protein [Oscillospiraceae bacterium]
MKATSKLISVVLILALCLSMFTVSAFAAVPVTGGDASKVFGGYHPGVRQPAVVDDADADDAQAETPEESAEKEEVVVKDGVTAVASAGELQAALDAKAASIQLTEQIDWVGSLELDYDVTIDLGGKGKGIAFSGSGDAAVLSSANASLVNGNLFVSGDVAATDAADAVPGFGTVAAGVGEGTVYLNGVYVSFSNDGGNAIFGQGVSLGSGVFSQDVTSYYGEEAAAAYDFATLENGMFDVTAKAAAPEVPDTQDKDENEPVEGADAANGEVVSVTGEYGEGADKIVVIVSGANMPKDLRVDVKPMDVSEVAIGDEEVLFVVDITLYAKNEDGEEFIYEPSEDPNVKEVNVTIRHPALGNVEEGEAVTLYHIVNEQAVPVTPTEEMAGQDTLEFTTDSFSPYAATVVTTGSDGDVHYREVKILGNEIFIVGEDIVLNYTGNKDPIAVSIVPYEDALSGDYEVYEHGLLLSGGAAVGDGDEEYTVKDGVLTIKADATKAAPEGKFGIVFWYQDQGTMVYMVQPIILVNEDGVFGVGDDFTPTDEDFKGTTGIFDAEMCDYDSVQVKMTGDLKSFKIENGDVEIEYPADGNMKKILMDGKKYNASEYFTVDEYYASDPMGHQFVAGKVLTLSQSLMKKIGFHDDDSVKFTVEAEGSGSSSSGGGGEGGEGGESGDSTYTGEFIINITPGIRVADGLDDYIKGKNLWVKFQACAPID